jgi:glycosyltransferase involved in cell wall biosynthesis
MRVAVADLGKAGWTAGEHYLRNLLTALGAVASQEGVQTLLLRPPGRGGDSLAGLAEEVWELPLAEPAPTGAAARLRAALVARGLLPPPPSPLGRRLRAAGVDCLFAAREFGPRLGVPLVAWIPDFQHRRLPEMFTPEELRRRDEAFRRILERAQRVVLSSRAALGDLEEFAPELAAKARVVPFVAHLPPEARRADPREVCRRYHLPQRFFYLPNQFWAHKNHRLVLEALAILAARGRRVSVVCSGNTTDTRNPLFFGRLLAEVSARGLRERFILLGLVEHLEVFALMRQSLAVLQPSLFEGWSTTVEEVKSLGKAIVLSDIPVHREQAPPRAWYFDPGDPEELAARLERLWEELAPGPDAELEEAAAAALPSRSRAFGRAVAAVLREAVEAAG